MSADKHRSLNRRRALLAKAKADPLRINCEGGIGSDNRDLARLVEEGLVRTVRYRNVEGDRWPAPKRFRTGGGVSYAPTTRAVITDAGKAFLADLGDEDVEGSSYSAPTLGR